jgi:predicted kinase
MPALDRPEGIAQQIARHIRTDIESGRLRDRQPLRSTRELAKEWGVSVNTIDAALKPLTDAGLIVVKDRKGRYVNYPSLTALNTPHGDQHVIVIGGYAGSGKTELGRILSRTTNWPLLDKDSVSRPMTEAALALAGHDITDRESELYLSKIRPAEYETLTLVMLENIECGNNVIISAPFIREFKDQAWINRLAAKCSDIDAQVTFVWVRVDAESMLTYLRHRGAARDTWKLNHWDEYIANIDTEFEPSMPHVIINNSIGSAPLKDQATDLLIRVRS